MFAPRARITPTMWRYAFWNLPGPTSSPELYGALHGFQSPFTSVPYSTMSGPDALAASAQAARFWGGAGGGPCDGEGGGDGEGSRGFGDDPPQAKQASASARVQRAIHPNLCRGCGVA